jgi:hypothetical protein
MMSPVAASSRSASGLVAVEQRQPRRPVALAEAHDALSRPAEQLEQRLPVGAEHRNGPVHAVAADPHGRVVRGEANGLFLVVLTHQHGPAHAVTADPHKAHLTDDLHPAGVRCSGLAEADGVALAVEVDARARVAAVVYADATGNPVVTDGDVALVVGRVHHDRLAAVGVVQGDGPLVSLLGAPAPATEVEVAPGERRRLLVVGVQDAQQAGAAAAAEREVGVAQRATSCGDLNVEDRLAVDAEEV